MNNCIPWTEYQVCARSQNSNRLAVGQYDLERERESNHLKHLMSQKSMKNIERERESDRNICSEVLYDKTFVHFSRADWL